jgi:hypothetical protein
LTTNEAAATGQDPVDLIVDSVQVQEKCTKQFAMNASKNVKFLLNQPKASQSIAENVSEKRILIQDSNFEYYSK